MIVIQAKSQIYKWCLVITTTVCLTSILNVIYMIQKHAPNGNNEFETLPSMVIDSNTALKTSLHSLQSQPEDSLFHDEYQKFLNTFTDNILPIKGQDDSQLYCPAVPPNLQGPMKIISHLPKDFSLTHRSMYHPDVQLGGHYRPKTCVARHKVAIIVPYRDRWDILKHFLFHTHQFLQRQQLDYRIYVCEQAFDQTFNKGIVMNSCFKEILQIEPNTICFIMHDVDLLLIDDRNMYSCPPSPRHLSVAIDKFDFYLLYPELVGGVLAMRREHFILVNGYSTNYWGWGGEDDDMYKRILGKHLMLERPPNSIARYKMLKHQHQKLNPSRLKVLRTAHRRIDKDGVNNVEYKLMNVTLHYLYTHILIDVGKEPK